jgi:hypothetical protein
MNGATPATSYCSSGYGRAVVSFRHATNSHYDDSIEIGDCNSSSSSNPYTWSIQLRPGTYAVSVTGENYSALPHWDIVINSSFSVSAATANVALNVVDPVKVSVSGTVTMNGATPATSYCSSGYGRAVVNFNHATNSHYDDSIEIGDCSSSSSSNTYTWSLALRPGIYRVSVTGENYSALPHWSIVVVDRLTVQ